MRLLNIYTLELEEFVEAARPPYFILSHRWDGKETSYQDFITGRSTASAGHQKIEEFCAFSRIQVEDPTLRGIFGDTVVEWVWIDTCCIDKRSSAELSEAINSMFQWYKNAVACFVYLSDVPAGIDDYEQLRAFTDSSWFLRGWTLQELLAPEKIVFCDSAWAILGCMNAPGHWRPQTARENLFEAVYGPSLTDAVAWAAGIRKSYLCRRYRSGLNESSLAERFSWAAKRKTTRIEDEAYCLLGLFEINMPLLYGEGPRAFRRLQQAIVQQSTDKSIFAWKLPFASGTSFEKLFAESPSYFGTGLRYDIGSYDDGGELTLTNCGLRIRKRGVRITASEFNDKIRCLGGRSVVETQADVFFLRFECTGYGYPQPPLVLALARRDDVRQCNQFVRICTDDVGKNFDELFALKARPLEKKQAFFISV